MAQTTDDGTTAPFRVSNDLRYSNETFAGKYEEDKIADKDKKENQSDGSLAKEQMKQSFRDELRESIRNSILKSQRKFGSDPDPNMIISNPSLI